MLPINQLGLLLTLGKLIATDHVLFKMDKYL